MKIIQSTEYVNIPENGEHCILFYTYLCTLCSFFFRPNKKHLHAYALHFPLRSSRLACLVLSAFLFVFVSFCLSLVRSFVFVPFFV